MAAYTFRRMVGLLVFLGCSVLSQVSVAQKGQASIVRTYYDYRKQVLHEEYQFTRTANKLVVKNGYYKEYYENGMIKEKSFYINDKLNGSSTLYEDFDKGPEPSVVYTYKFGKRNGLTTIWGYDGGRRYKTLEGRFVNDVKEGRQVDYDNDGSRKVSNYSAGVLNGEYIEYDTTGQPILEGYLNEGEKFSGTLDEAFDNGKPSKSVTYNDGRRAGPTQTWYPNGKLRTLTQYRNGQQDGPTLHYLETGEPDEATKVALVVEVAKRVAGRADSIKLVQDAVAASQRRALERRAQDSVRRADKAAATAEWAEAQNLKTAAIMLAKAYAKQQMLVRSGAQSKLCINLYNRLTADYEATAGAAKLLRAQRLLALVNLAEALYQGEQPELNKAIRKENDLDKVLALTGL